PRPAGPRTDRRAGGCEGPRPAHSPPGPGPGRCAAERSLAGGLRPPGPRPPRSAAPLRSSSSNIPRRALPARPVNSPAPDPEAFPVRRSAPEVTSRACAVWPEVRSCAQSASEMPVTVGPYGQSQPSCFDRVKLGFMMGFAVGMAAGAFFGTFSCVRMGMRGRELMGGVGKTMMQSGGTFGTFMAIGMGIRC
uniref:Reactive oxygen species modulator 1 n=1 Tax=Pelusios castaneus TaxID=367368 RepID=A0A8C8SHU2_9SAUR